MSDDPRAGDLLRALRRTRQVREFTAAAVAEDQLQAILEVARWTGSSQNRQPWTLIVLRDPALRGRVAGSAPSAAHVARAPVALAVVMPGEKPVLDAFDEGRLVERVLVAATALGLGAAVGWTSGEGRTAIGELLGVEPPAFVRSLISIGHATEAAGRARTTRGAARKPLDEIVREAGSGDRGDREA